MKNKKLIFMSVLMFLLIIIILFFGIRLKGYKAENHVTWNQKSEGLVFQQGNSLAHTDYFSTEAFSSTKEFSIEMAISPDIQRIPSFSFILHLPNPDNDWQIVIGQWDATLVVLNNSDYSNKERMPKIYAPFDLTVNPNFIQITSGESGTRVYINGKLKGSSEKLLLAGNEFDKQIILITGNSIYSRNPWNGTWQGLALYNRKLDKEALQSHYKQWLAGGSFGFIQKEDSRLLYMFEENTGNVIYNKSNSGPNLIIPENIPVLVKRILSWPDLIGSNTESMKYDIFINLAGFIPLGFVVCGWFLIIRKDRKLQSLFFCVLSGFLLSLFIEITQVWMPSRDSSLLDLILNTLGTLAGGKIYIITESIRRKASQR